MSNTRRSFPFPLRMELTSGSGDLFRGINGESDVWKNVPRGGRGEGAVRRGRGIFFSIVERGPGHGIGVKSKSSPEK